MSFIDKKMNNKFDVVVGIDFGSSGTGYAFSFNNPKEIILGYLKDQGPDVKVPTEIILDKNLNFIAFGGKCKKYIELKNKLKEGELHFQKIKMSLYHDQTTIKPQNQSTEYPLDEIISKVLKHVKEEAIKTISEKRPTINENKIKWVVTVPAIWKENQKGIMMKASEKAGLFNDCTNRANFFALEPEAASLFCSQDSAIEPKYIEPGKTFIICDLGGGTGDIVTHSKKEKDEIKEKYQANGGNFGSNEIDKKIFSLIINKIFGFEEFNSLEKKNEKIQKPYKTGFLYQQWKLLEDEIQIKKKITEDIKDDSFYLDCRIFEKFTDGKNIKDLINLYNKNCRDGWEIKLEEDNWFLTCPNKIFYDLITRQAEKISEQIEKITENIPDVESIIYVGGYCQNEILINYFKTKFNGKNIVHLKPSYPDLAVVKGAVLFGINPNIITERKAKYSIGLSVREKWDETIHGNGEKIFDEKNKCYYCNNCFNLFFEKGQTLSINDTITHHLEMSDSRYCYLGFYRSIYKKNPNLCSEDGVEKIGEDRLDLKTDFKDDERDIEVIMKFGGTYVEAECIHKKSRQRIKTNLYFDKQN